ncbi:hypothetical protein [Streptomyces sp. NPDC059378]|uniref:hypothetical protein n=1 Tax=Streptomyces sp. NPDC059378 TaxID=3346815 RepID=UPI003679437A
MPKLGELTIEEPIHGADRDAAYLAELLEKLAREPVTDPDDIQAVITRATITQRRSQLIVAQGKLREDRRAQQKPPATAPAITRPVPERSQHQAADEMTAHLVALRVAAQTTITGGNCWATSVDLTPTMELNNAPGEVWSWSLYLHGGDQVISGHWGSADGQTVASKAQALIQAMGAITA